MPLLGEDPGRARREAPRNRLANDAHSLPKNPGAGHVATIYKRLTGGGSDARHLQAISRLEAEASEELASKSTAGDA